MFSNFLKAGFLSTGHREFGRARPCPARSKYEQALEQWLDDCVHLFNRQRPCLAVAVDEEGWC